jgi:hypothetical protein
MWVKEEVHPLCSPTHLQSLSWKTQQANNNATYSTTTAYSNYPSTNSKRLANQLTKKTIASHSISTVQPPTLNHYYVPYLYSKKEMRMPMQTSKNRRMLTANNCKRAKGIQRGPMPLTCVVDELLKTRIALSPLL